MNADFKDILERAGDPPRHVSSDPKGKEMNCLAGDTKKLLVTTAL